MYELSEYFRFHISTAKISVYCPKSWDKEKENDKLFVILCSSKEHLVYLFGKRLRL
jgi:hypothetical protein